MEKDDNYSNEAPMPPNFSGHHHLYNNQDQFMRSHPLEETSADNSAAGILSYFPANTPPPLQPITSLDKLSFAEVMQFADFGPKLSLNRFDEQDEPASGIDPVYFLKFPVLNNERAAADEEEEAAEMGRIVGELEEEENFMNNNNNNYNKNNKGNNNNNNNNNKRKRGRSVKTSEEVESQRMTHIAVERNRRKQMNEHLRVLRSLMPGSYVQRGDQASIIGGAIEFVRELEQLLQCLESQKRRRLVGESPLQAADPPPPPSQQQQQPPFGGDQNDGQMFETTAESKSCVADVEVKVLGLDAMIKILSRRRPGQLIKAIAALEDLQLNILHTNITTIEQTVLYSFNVKVASESRFTAEDIASSVQQIFSFIHANTGM